MPTVEDIYEQKREELKLEETREYNPFDPYRFGWCGIAVGGPDAEPGIVGTGMDDVGERTGLDYESDHNHTYLILTDTNDTYAGYNSYFPKVSGSQLVFSKILDSDVPSPLTRKTYRSNKQEAFVLNPYA